MMTTQKQVRADFWENGIDAETKRRFWHPTFTQNQYPADVRMAFCDYVEHLARDGQISEALAQRVTL